MARNFSAVAPVSLLEGLQKRGALGCYNLVLSHNVLQNRASFARLVHGNQFAGVWIVDNSVIELGRPAEAEIIAEACNVFKLSGLQQRNEVVAVLPDELLDMEGTIRTTDKAIDTFAKAGLNNFMFVPQGKSAGEILECAEKFQDIQAIKWIGVARNFESDGICTREFIIPLLRAIYPYAKLHLLGFSRKISSDIRCTKMDGVEGIDSAMPLRLTEPISLLSSYPKRGDWWQEGLECTDLMEANVKRVRQWLRA